MAEVEKLIKARDYCMKLANGIDPISDKSIPNDTVLNQLPLARLFFFLTNHLSDEIHSNSITSHKSKQKMPFLISRKSVSEIEITLSAIPISEFCKRVFAKATPSSKAFNYKWVTDWLLKTELMKLSETDGKRYPTESGTAIGIFQEQRMVQGKAYMATLYSKDAQQFLIDNMDSILAAQGYSILP